MKMPSRQTLAKLIFFTFIIFFVAIIVLYLFNPFGAKVDPNDPFADEKRGTVWSPFGSLFSNDEDPADITRPITDDETVTPGDDDGFSVVPKLRQISRAPTVAGIFYLDRKEIAETAENLGETPENPDFEAFKKNTIRYVLKENGHVYETTSTSLAENRLSNTTVPKVGEAFFMTPLTLVYRYLDDELNIKTFSAEIIDNPNGTEGQKLQGIFLPDNILDIDTNIAGTILYSEKTPEGSSFVTTNYLGEDKQRVFSSPLSEFNIDFQSKASTAMLISKPSVASFGQIFTLNTQTGSFDTLYSGFRALSGLTNSNLSQTAVTHKEGENHVLKIRNNSTGELYNTGLETFTEKCTWSLDNVTLYCGIPEGKISAAAPDSWYQGIDSYTDMLWSINVLTQSFEIIMSPLEIENESIDMVDIKLSTDEQFIYFINKKDLTLWSYKLN